MQQRIRPALTIDRRPSKTLKARVPIKADCLAILLIDIKQPNGHL